MMGDHRVTISGASDDLIEVDGEVPGCDEYNAESASFVINGEKGQVRIGVSYGRGGVWGITVAPVDEEIPMLAVHVEGDRYTAVATIDGAVSVVREAVVDA